jgi:hypothetical protein
MDTLRSLLVKRRPDDGAEAYYATCEIISVTIVGGVKSTVNINSECKENSEIPEQICDRIIA